MYALKNNVYMVKGFKAACIYDINTCSLYHINMNLYNWIDELISRNEELKDYTLPEKEILTQLLAQDILEEVNVRVPQPNLPKKISRPEFAWIEITTQCNLKCIHCYDESDITCTKQMSMEDYGIAIRELKSLGIKRVQIIGGEPFMVGSKLRDMLSTAVANFDSVEIFTNGTMLTDRWAEFFSENKIKVALSVYSYDPIEHDKVTGQRGSHALTNQAIMRLRENGVKYRVCNVLMKGIDLKDRNTDLYTLSDKRDIVRLAGRADMQLLSRNLIRKKIITEESFSYELNPQLFYKLCNENNCFGSKLYISADMEVYPCVMERRISHGNLKNSDLKNLLNDTILKLGKDHIEGCKDCEYRYACFDCRANSMSNNIYEKPWYCTYNPYLGEWEDPDQFIERLFDLDYS